MRPESLRRAAWAGLQDSMPRAALLSLHARVDGVESSTLDDPSLAQLWGPRYNTYVVAKRDFALFSLGRYPDDAKKRLRAERLAEQLHAHLDGRRATDREIGRALRIGNEMRYMRQRLARSPSAGRAHGHRSSGPSPRPRSIPPTRAVTSLDATSTSSGRPRRTRSPAGPGSLGVRQPTHSPRSKDHSSRFDRRSATSSCSRRTRRPCVAARRPPRPRACYRAAMRFSCSTELSVSCSCRARISGSGSGRPASGRARSSSTARSAEPGDALSTPFGSRRGHASRVPRAIPSRPRHAPCRFPSNVRSRWSGASRRVRSRRQ